MKRTFYHRDWAMGIVGDRPESGVRIAVERDARGGSPWRYEGTATTPDDAYPVHATIDAGGEVTVETAPGAPPDLAEKVRLILRTVVRQAKTDGNGTPARKIVRWRPDV
jgi:hypothetical protein